MDEPKEAQKNDANPLVSAAKVIGSAVGKIASLAGAGGEQPSAAPAPADPNLYRAEYAGSGTFNISKPRRQSKKIRQSRLKNPQRGARK